MSRVLNQKKGRYSKETEQKIMDAINETNYEFNSIAQSLRLKRTNTIGVIIPDLNNFFFARLVQEVERKLFELGYTLIICTTEMTVEKEDMYLRMLAGKMVDGIIIVSGERTCVLNSYFHSKPVVCIDRKSGMESNMIFINSDHYQGGELVAEHLVKSKCKRFVYVTSENDLLIDKVKYNGFNDKLVHMKKEKSAVIEISSKDRFSKTGATTEIISQLLQKNEFSYDGVFCSDDRVAVGVIRALADKQLLVPENVKVVGYGNDPIAKYVTPSLTSVRPDRLSIAKRAVSKLINEIEKEETNNFANSREIIPVKLIKREST